MGKNKKSSSDDTICSKSKTQNTVNNASISPSNISHEIEIAHNSPTIPGNQEAMEFEESTQQELCSQSLLVGTQNIVKVTNTKGTTSTKNRGKALVKTPSKLLTKKKVTGKVLKRLTKKVPNTVTNDSKVKNSQKSCARTKRVRPIAPSSPSSSSSSSSSSTTDTSSTDSEQEVHNESLAEQVKTMAQSIKNLSDIVMKQQGIGNVALDSANRYSTEASRVDNPISMGEFPFAVRNLPEHNSIAYTSGLKAGDNLSESLKIKIYNHKYVDFHNILYPDSDDSYLFALNNRDAHPTLNLTPKRKRQLSEREWSIAFDDFVAVYCRRYPHDLQDLLTYSKFIKGLMKNGDNWADYDIKFRKDREFSLCKWSLIRVDLQINASRSSKTEQTNRPHQTSFLPKGFCYNFHSRQNFCNRGKNCTYKHSCPKCDRIHPAHSDCTSYRKQVAQENSQPFQQSFTPRKPIQPYFQPPNPSQPGTSGAPFKRL